MADQGGMTTIKRCPRCGKLHPYSAATCDGCGRQFRTTAPPQEVTQYAVPPAPQPAQTQPARTVAHTPPWRELTAAQRTIIKATVLIGALAIFGILLPDRADKYSAYDYCRDQVRAALKAPSTAKFAYFDSDSAQDLGNGRWRCASTVQAENSFGVPLEESWSVTAKYDGKGAWETLHLELGGETLIDVPDSSAPSASSPQPGMGAGVQ